MIKNILAWDLGATKCTAGLVEYNDETHELHCKKYFKIKLREVTSLEHLIHQLEVGLGFSAIDADAVCIGAAGHYDGEYLLLENAYPYSMNFAEIAKQNRWPAYAVIHDYAPIVCATFTAYMDEPKNIKRLNAFAARTEGRRVALGMGTGLGLKDGVLFPGGDFWLGKNEIGHIGITTPPMATSEDSKRHNELMQFLQAKAFNLPNESITFEKILSGSGIVRLYQFFHSDVEITPEEVGEKMRAGKTDELLNAFAWYTGLFVGTIQLIFMPESGVWITGGVALNNLDIFDKPDFFAGILASPAYRLQREEYPLGVLCNYEHALIGCGYYASKRLMS